MARFLRKQFLLDIRRQQGQVEELGKAELIY